MATPEPSASEFGRRRLRMDVLQLARPRIKPLGWSVYRMRQVDLGVWRVFLEQVKDKDDQAFEALLWISEYPNRTPNSEDDSDAIALAAYAQRVLDKIDGAVKDDVSLKACADFSPHARHPWENGMDGRHVCPGIEV